MRNVARVVGLIGLLAVIGGADGTGCDLKTKKQKEAEKLPSVDVTAKEIYAAYKENEVSADSQYRDRMLNVSGKISRIAKDIMDDPVVNLGVGQFDTVDAHFDKDDGSLGTLKRGQQVTLHCRGNNVVLGNPQLADCKL